MASFTTPASLLRLASPAVRSASSSGCRTSLKSQQFSSWRFEHSYKSGNRPGSIQPIRKNVTALLLCRRNTLNVSHVNSSNRRGIWNSIRAIYGAPTLSKSLLDPQALIENGHSVISQHLRCCPLVSSFHVLHSHCSIYPPHSRPMPPAYQNSSHQPTLHHVKRHKPCCDGQHKNNSSTRNQTSSNMSSSSSTPTRQGSSAECVYKLAASYGDRVAITDVDGDHTYSQLLARRLEFYTTEASICILGANFLMLLLV